MRNAAVTAGALVLVLTAAPNGAQAPQPVDSGRLTCTASTPMGVRTYIEDFALVRNTDGGYTMTTVSSGSYSGRTVLTTAASGAPTWFEQRFKGDEAAEVEVISKKAEGSGALVITELSRRNPPVDPFLFSPNTLLFAQGGVAHVWFFALGSVPRDVSYFEPSTFWRNGAQNARLSSAGSERVSIAGSEVTATHFAITGGVRPREFWLDSEKRLLKVSVGTGTRLVWTRTALPK